MIVVCERCSTEFHLDDARVPETGARVRCSRCKHAFFVTRPASTPEEEIDRAASLALEDDPTPGVTEDLPDEPVPAQMDAGDDLVDDLDAGGLLGEELDEDPVTGRGEDSESDWEFNGDLPAEGDESSPDLHGTHAPPMNAPHRKTDRFGDEDSDGSLDLADDEPAAPPAREPDSPVDWDFLDRGAERAAPVAAAPSGRVITVEPDQPREIASESQHPTGAAPLALRRVAVGAGWLATAGLCAIAFWYGLAPAAPAATSWPNPAPGIAIEQVRGRWLDNLSVGRLYVVSGRVHNVAPTAASLPPLVLELRDAAGQPVGSPIPVRGSSFPGNLRTASAAELAAAGADVPGGLAPGVTWDFEVVAWPLPDHAARFAIRAGS